jgi:hypothetical protein
MQVLLPRVGSTLAALLLVACGGTDGGGGGDGDGGDQQGDLDGGTGSGADAEAEEQGPPYCHQECGGPEDCATPDVPQFEAKNFDCDDGLCSWKGCLSDDDCLEDYVCRGFGDQIPTCTAACGGEGVCGAGHPDPILDSDNYECEDGGCRWLGCHGDECVERHDEQWSCTEAIFDFPNCLKSCETPTDCAPEYDWADVVDCFEGFCVVSCDATSCGDSASCF